MMRVLTTALICTGTAIAAGEDQFVYDNLTGTFYHELAHALVHQLEIPIYGQEEDAADVLASYLIPLWNDDAAARRIARNVALTFYSDFVVEEDEGDDVAWDSLHGPAKQRMYNHLCVLIGEDPREFNDIGEAFNMDEERLTDCDVEYDYAKFSWGFIIEDLQDEDEGGLLVSVGSNTDLDSFVGRWARAELARINSVITFPKNIPVVMKECGEFNAFYDTELEEIQMCLEQDAAHREQFRQFGDRFPIDGMVSTKGVKSDKVP